MVYLILLGLSVITPLFAFYFSEQMDYHLHYKKLARSDKWFWQRDLSDEELDQLAHDKSKKFARIAAWVISLRSISGFVYISYLSFSDHL